MSYKNDPTWTIDPADSMCVLIFKNHYDYEAKKPMMRISVEEIIESAGRKNVMKHVKECDNTPWLLKWRGERDEALVDLLKQ